MTRETELAAALVSRAAYCNELASMTVGGTREMHRTNAELFRHAAAALATQAKESVWERHRRETRHNPACPHCKRGYAIHGEYGGTALIRVYHITPDGTPVPHEVLPNESSAAQQAPPELAGERAFKCAARQTSIPEPQDCNWPICGCDSYAGKVIAALEESGLLTTPPQPLDGVTEEVPNDLVHYRGCLQNIAYSPSWSLARVIKYARNCLLHKDRLSVLPLLQRRERRCR